MTLLLIVLFLLLGLLYAELYHRARKLILRHYPECTLESEKAWDRRHYDQPGYFMGEFNRNINVVNDFAFSRSCCHAIPQSELWIFDLLYLTIWAMRIDLAAFFLYMLIL